MFLMILGSIPRQQPLELQSQIVEVWTLALQILQFFLLHRSTPLLIEHL